MIYILVRSVIQNSDLKSILELTPVIILLFECQELQERQSDRHLVLCVNIYYFFSDLKSNCVLHNQSSDEQNSTWDLFILTMIYCHPKMK